MNLEKLMEEKIQEEQTDTKKRSLLWDEIEKIKAAAVNHLGQITVQMPDYDIHDEKHSQKVLENIELLLGEKARELSYYELVLIYLSCFLHDAAMALPKWEYEMLHAVEGCEAIFDNTVQNPIKNDLKAPQSLSELKGFIEQHQESLYGKFEQAGDFIFSPDDETDFQLDIAQRARGYEQFRNEYAEQLEAAAGDPHQYLELSRRLRVEFIRKTHHTRVVDYIKNLRRLLSGKIGTAAAVKLLEDLSKVCQSHGEGTEFIESLSVSSRIDQIGEANLQFIAILLRLGDVIHFSADRAPLSLLSEKRILDESSRIHWKSKLNDTQYKITVENGKTVIKFSAYCSEPAEYYFLYQYLDLVDRQIACYFSFLHNLEYLKSDNISKYDLQLSDRVDRSDVIADETRFIPDHTAKFTMDQSKIFALLMGAQLYKDKYLCLRELYQNALDACKCMRARDMNAGVSAVYRIAFGLEEDSRGRKYIYCLDQGTGMTKEIVKNYFLRIGNSYYKSHEFISSNVGWMNKVCPTSQFGIGVLSCFMLGETLEVTTRYVDSSSEAFSFCLEAESERFYYIPASPLDKERIGPHGTMIKIFLSEEEAKAINDEVPEDYRSQIYSGRLHEKRNSDQTCFWNSIFYKVNRQIGICSPGIEVVVYSQGKPIPIVPQNEIFDVGNLGLGLQKIGYMWINHRFVNETENIYKEVLECRDYIKNIPIHISIKGIELDTFVTLPLRDIPYKNCDIFYFEQYTWGRYGSQVFVDGVLASDSNFPMGSIIDLFGFNLWQTGDIILNFVGKDRPILSVDRNSIIEWPTQVVQICAEIVKKLVECVAAELISHFEKEQLSIDSDEAGLALDVILRKYRDFSSKLFLLMNRSSLGNMEIQDVNLKNEGTAPTIDRIIDSQFLTLTNINLRTLNFFTYDLVISKLMPASRIELSDSDISVESKDFLPLSDVFNGYQRSFRSFEYVIKADVWTGAFESFDMVSKLWPLVPERMFNCLDCLNEEQMPTSVKKERVKFVRRQLDELKGIAQFEPALINPKFGISLHFRAPFEDQEQECLIGRCERIYNGFRLLELNRDGELIRQENKDYAVFVYIAPKELSDDDETALKDYVGRDDTYVQGVREGWSILFLGYDQKYYILPGICEKSRLIEQVPTSIRERKGGITYYNLDGTKLFPETAP